MSDPEFEDIGISRTESTTRRAHLAPALRARVWMKELVNRASAQKKCRRRPARRRRFERVSLKRAAALRARGRRQNWVNWAAPPPARAGNG